MILRSIRVWNWRCFLEPVEVGPFAEDLNVLYGPNATGKSTLFEALLRGLLDGHRVSGREIEAVRPWGRSLAPGVTIEFAHAGTEYRVTKGFLEAAEAVLERKEKGRFRRVAEGDAADAQMRTILRSNPPGRGLAREENWGLAQVLWAPQGNLAITSLSGDLLSDIRASLGAQVSGPEAGPVEERIEEAYRQFFTPTGKLKAGKDAPTLVRLREKLDQALQKHAGALEQQQAFEEASRKIEDLQAREVQAKRDAEEIIKTLKEARTEAESYKALLSEKKQRAAQLEAAEAQYNELKQRLDTIKSLRKELEEKRKQMHKLQADLPVRAREVESREKEAAEAKAALEDVRKGRQAVDDAQEVAEEARRFLEGLKRLADIDDRLEKVAKAHKELTSRKKEYAEFLAPNAKSLRAIRKAVKERDEAQLRIDASLITLEIVPEKKGSLKIVAGEEPGKRSLHPGRPKQVKGSPEVVVDWAGVGRLRASGPTGPVEELRAERDKADRRLQRLTEPFGTADIEELEALSEKAQKLEKKVAQAQTQIETLLSGQSVENIEQERARIAATLEKISEKHPDWQESPPDSEALARAAVERKRSFVSAVEAAEGRWEAAQTALTGAAAQRTGLETQLRQLSTQVQSLESRLSELTEDGKTEEQLQKELKKMALAWHAARASVEEIEDKLSAFTEDPVATTQKLEKQLEAARDAATKALKDEERERGRLEQLCAGGPYSSLAEAEEEVAELKSQIREEELRAEAIRLIHDTVGECRSEALASVAAPVEAAATRTLVRIAGPRLVRLRLGESFEPVNVLPGVSASSVPLESVSGGEREQIYLATRLALADVLARDERQLAVLDDVLTFTDAGRLARVMTILEEAAQHLQLLILTCHPERYRALEDAHFFDLEAIVRADVRNRHSR